MFHGGISESEKKLGAHEKMDKSKFPEGGVTEKRSTTDILFLLALILAWAAMTGVGSDAVRLGQPEALINGFDYKGRLCGFDSGVQDLPNMYPVLASGVGVCVDACPSAADGTTTSAASSASDVYCVTDDSTLVTASLTCAASVPAGLCPCTIKYDSTEVFNHCIVVDPTVLSDFSDTTAGNYMTNFFADIRTAAPVIFGFGYGVALLLGLFYCRLLRVGWIAYGLVWFCILSVMVALWVLTGYMWTKALKWKRQDPAIHSNEEIMALKVVAWGSGCAAFLYVCLMIALRKRINLAVAMVKEAAACMNAFPIIVLTPILQYLGIAAFLLPWVFYVVYLAGMAEIKTVSVNTGGTVITTKEVSYSDEVYHRGWYMLFVLFWTLNFVVAVGQIANAMAVSTWYFTRNKSDVGNSTVVSAYRKTIRYHLGTAAFGSLVIAIVETFRAYVAYMQRQAKRANNKVAEMVLCCIGCLLWCIDKCLKFICRHAYIQTAMFSKSFCFACKDVVFLILRNIARVSAVTMVSSFILLIGKVFVTAATGTTSYFFLANYYDDKLRSLIAPTVLIVFLAWYTAGMFAEVFGMAIDTILVCFIADEEMFEPGERFADHDLRSFIDTNGKAPEEEAKPQPVKETQMAETGTKA